jgi:hypothetical protein
VPYVPPEDELAKRKKNYYRNKRPDLDPQSTASRVLEMFGLDEPYRNDSGSYDYRKKAWDESVAEGNPDMAWFGHPFRDQDVETAVDFLGDLPDGWKGTREREGNKAVGALVQTLDSWNYTPWDTADILSTIGPDSPDTVRRDLYAFKGGPSSIDDAIGDAMQMPREENWDPEYDGSTRQAVVEGNEWLGTLLPMGVVGVAKRTAQAGARGVKKVGGAVQRYAAHRKKLPAVTPQKPKAPPVSDDDVRSTLERAMRKSAAK